MLTWEMMTDPCPAGPILKAQIADAIKVNTGSDRIIVHNPYNIRNDVMVMMLSLLSAFHMTQMISYNSRVGERQEHHFRLTILDFSLPFHPHTLYVWIF